MKVILGEEINELIEKKDFQGIENIQVDDGDIVDIDQLPLVKTPKGINLELIKNLFVSHCGERVWGSHITEHPKCKLLMQCFRTKKSLLFNYEHQKITSAMMIAEDLGLAMTGIYSGITVLHCLISGKTIKVLDIRITCFYRLGSVVVVTDFEEQISLFDLVKQQILDIAPAEIGLDITCMQRCIRQSPKNNQESQLILFLGEIDSTEITEIILPEAIAKKSIINLIFLMN
jgi:hypothetical protein